MKRMIYKQLLKWKENKDRKPLMLLGARQVGNHTSYYIIQVIIYYI